MLGIVGNQWGFNLDRSRERLQRYGPNDQVRLILQGFFKDHQVLDDRHGRIGQVIGPNRLACRTGQPSLADQAAQGVVGLEQCAPGGAVTDQDDPEFVRGFGPGVDLMAGEHHFQVVDAEVVGFLRVLAKWQAHAPGPEVVIEGNLSHSVALRDERQGKVQDQEQQESLEKDIPQEFSCSICFL